MAPSKKNSTKARASPQPNSPPPPFKQAPEVLEPFYETLSRKHVYVAHVDTKPRDFKRKIFAVPVVLNVVIAALFAWRMWYITPYYFKLLISSLGHSNELTVVASQTPWRELVFTILRRTFTFVLDFVLFIFVWPWPVEFCLGQTHGNPVAWRWNVGFRDQEIYVRRSRSWDESLGDVLTGAAGKSILLSTVASATSPMLTQEKTGYLTMNGEWDLDWRAMVHATSLVDRKAIALDAFRTLVLLFHEDHGWLCVDLKLGENAREDDKRRQVFAFRDALASVGKEDLFFRWIEIVQFESSQPGGFGPDKQDEVAKKIRELFSSEGIDFDEFWAQSVGSDVSAGL